jgi:hypothetical protein
MRRLQFVKEIALDVLLFSVLRATHETQCSPALGSPAAASSAWLHAQGVPRLGALDASPG